MITFFIALLVACIVVFALGFIAGFQRGEGSIHVRMKYTLMQKEKEQLQLACMSLQYQLLKRGIEVTGLDSYEDVEA